MVRLATHPDSRTLLCCSITDATSVRNREVKFFRCQGDLALGSFMLTDRAYSEKELDGDHECSKG